MKNGLSPRAIVEPKTEEIQVTWPVKLVIVHSDISGSPLLLVVDAPRFIWWPRLVDRLDGHWPWGILVVGGEMYIFLTSDLPKVTFNSYIYQKRCTRQSLLRSSSGRCLLTLRRETMLTVLSSAGKTLQISEIYFAFAWFLSFRNYDYLWRDEECWGSEQQARGVLCQQ